MFTTTPRLKPKSVDLLPKTLTRGAVERFSRELKSESTVQGFKKAKDPDKVLEITHGLRGRRKKLGDLDQKVQVYIRKLRAAGTPVNRHSCC